jgi:branched-chain amino acid transport system substrate-binding protein
MTRAFLISLLRILVAAVVLLGGAYWLLIKDMYYTPASELRAGREWPPASVRMVVPWPHDGRVSLNEGVTLALEELNASTSALAGKIQIEFIDDPVVDSDHGRIARQIAKDNSVMVVIGHEQSETAIASAVSYEHAGILYLSPKASLTRLTEHGFNYTFRLVPDDEAFAEALARFASRNAWNTVGVLYGRFEQGEALASWFPLFAVRDGLKAAYFKSYLPARDYRRQDFRGLLAGMRTEETDAILLADQLPWAAKVLVDMQAMGFTQPVLAGDKLDSSDAWRLAGTAANNLYVASAVDPESKEAAYLAFHRKFFDRFKTNPGYGASQGYEAFRLFVQAAERSQSVDPVVIATTLKTNDDWQGIFGQYAFDNDGAITGRKVIIKRMKDGVFTTVGAEEVTK